LSRAISEARIRQSELVVVAVSPDEGSASLAAELAATGIPHRIHDTDGTLEPAEELINAAESLDADFIVIGLRRRSPVGKRLLGSNAQRVLLDASCAVLAVKADPNI
jgi:nucleotide-binding universal stress UspA family protein